MKEAMLGKAHFVLVHGSCHGAWSWYKVKPRLEAAGHRVTVVDLAASGVNLKAIEEVRTCDEYSKPLMEIVEHLPSKEKLVLVGHSSGGLSLALAMEKFPEKISVGVFLTAFMPDTIHRPSYVLEQYCERAPADNWLDTQFSSYGTSDEPATSMFFGPEFLSQKLYHLTPREDYTLATTLARPGSLFIENLSEAKNFSKGRYGSVSKVYVVCTEDRGIPDEFQRWMINNGGVNEVKEIQGADHMPMFSMPQQLCDCLLDIANKYA